MLTDVDTTRRKHTERFREVLRNKPAPGTVLRALDGGSVPVWVQDKPARGGRAPMRMMFATAAVDDTCFCWVLSRDTRGLKCLILPRSQARLLEQYPDPSTLQVDGLVVVRQTPRGTALLCELVENDDGEKT